MGKGRLNKGHAVPDFVDKFGTAIAHFSLKIRETANIKHTGSKGTERELNIAKFFGEILPQNYEASKGEAVDLEGRKSPQLDVLFFDRSKNFPFYRGDTVVLPAEALLASIEAKSKLNLDEIARSNTAATLLKSLRPMKKQLRSGIKPQDEESPSEHYRYLHCLFAYDTDLKKEDWARAELCRIEKAAGRPGDVAVDFLYVLKRGLIDCRSRKVIPEDENTGQALVAWWFAIYNFIERENGRRKPVPYFSYATDLNRFWEKIA